MLPFREVRRFSPPHRLREVDCHLASARTMRRPTNYLDVEGLDLGDLADVETGVKGVDRRHELEPVIAGNGLTTVTAHAATSAENADANSFPFSHDLTLMDGPGPHTGACPPVQRQNAPIRRLPATARALTDRRRQPSERWPKIFAATRWWSRRVTLRTEVR